MDKSIIEEQRKREEREQKWQNLTLADDFLFCRIMSEPALCAEMLHRIFPQLDVSDIKPVETQKTEKTALHIRGIRFDIFTRTAREIFDVETQKRKLRDLFRRARAYHIVIGYDGLNVNTLKKSGNYEALPNTYVVFICTFDPFGKGRHIYSFQSYCTEDKEITLNDGAYTVYLNTKGKLDDVSPELKRFLDFVEKNKVSEDDFIRTLDKKVKEAKKNTLWRSEYMTLLTIEDEIRAESFEKGLTEGETKGRAKGIAEGRAKGRAEGRVEGRAEGRAEEKHSIYERLVADGMSAQKASVITGWNL